MAVHTIADLGEILAKSGQADRLEVEIGCGNGHFLSEYCQKNRADYFIGLEIKMKRCLKAVAKIEKRGLNNASILHARAESFLEAIPAARVDRYHIYFPDPWPKNKHRKRRFLRMFNLELLYRSLKQEGSILFTTDFFDYYLQTKILFLLHPGLELEPIQPLREVLISIYGQKLKDVGKKLLYLAARKGSPAR